MVTPVGDGVRYSYFAFADRPTDKIQDNLSNKSHKLPN